MQLQFSHPSISDSEFVERIEQKKASFYRVAFGYTRNEDDALEVVHFLLLGFAGFDDPCNQCNHGCCG